MNGQGDVLHLVSLLLQLLLQCRQLFLSFLPHQFLLFYCSYFIINLGQEIK